MRNIFLGVLITLFIAVISYTIYLQIRLNKAGEFKLNNYNTSYVIDSVQMEKLLEKLKTKENEIYIKPLVITNYVIDSISNINYSIMVENERIKLINEQLQKTIEINKKFLTQFPYSSKLIESSISRDSLSFITLNIHGNTKKYLYPVNFNKFSYRFINDSLYASPTNYSFQNETQKKRFVDLYLQAGYQIFSNKPFIGVEAEKQLWKLKFNSELNLNIGKNPTMDLGIKVKYQLWQ